MYSVVWLCSKKCSLIGGDELNDHAFNVNQKILHPARHPPTGKKLSIGRWTGNFHFLCHSSPKVRNKGSRFIQPKPPLAWSALPKLLGNLKFCSRIPRQNRPKMSVVRWGENFLAWMVVFLQKNVRCKVNGKYFPKSLRSLLPGRIKSRGTL